jgi:ribosome-associated translation inhibitor RaiA
MYASIDMVVDKLERQIRSGKGAHKKRDRISAGQFAAAAAVDTDAEPEE